ncbi:unnamed protein product [Rotaria magnacalcarata]|uniref:TIL domain-containing protein n=2 Tax=Rotaria magnacalcarata TaxID=392030 RepID=A0A820C214_9BILA|nr:unnamed protein product [Rotaria magnacalcarata]CAF4208469.1 unnamed protein product [Rotaria magnacalcarata]CAF4216734.1 unnamed protein product [Rotaria magnacalcarata]
MQQENFNPYASIMVYSDRPNPRWQLSTEEWHQLSKLMDRLPKITETHGGPYQLDSPLGYSGFHAHFSIISSYPDIYYVANTCQAISSNPAGYMIFTDEQKQVENWFKDSAKKHGIGLVCGQNEIFKTCGSPCISTCTYKPAVCIAMCSTGCFCKEGYVRESNKTGSSCIKQEDCENVNVLPQCAENEELLTCGSACPPTCNDWSYPLPKEPTACIMICKRGCFCKQGLYRSKDGKCVKPEECCGKNEVFTSCGSACVETCNNKPDMCTDQCVAGCFCSRPDHVRLNNSTNSLCIPPNECPK